MENEILQQIVNKLDYVEKKLEKLDKLEQDVSEIKQDVAELKQDVAELERNYRRLNQTVTVMENDLTFKVNILYENAVDIIEQNRKIDRVKVKQDDHETRIWALVQVVKAEYS
jgi:archaellum component FlaC